VQPQSTSDVSKVMRIVDEKKCQFAVASGGHMSWKGSSNIEDHFVLDMRAMNEITVKVDEGYARLGPGSTWGEVYEAMTPYNVTVPGGRISQVGVGGFLLAGKWCFSTALGF
jgi:FAD/FMN-containing dehydrogenase